MEYVLLYIVGSAVTLFLVKLINKHTEIGMRLEIDEAIILMLVSWLGSIMAMVYFMLYATSSNYNNINKYLEAFKKWVEGE